MLTRCTHCETWFRVSAADLRPARGHVRCSRCMQTFDALIHLRDGAEPARAEATPAPTVDFTPGAPPARGAAAPEPAPGRPVEAPVPEVLREDLARLDGARAATRARAVYAAASVVLLVALGVQYTWFNAASVLARFPQSRPWVEALCERTGCALPERRETARIQIVSRDVRAHPRYEGALLVNATLMNLAPYPQRFPRMRFTLFNVNGQTIASRVFSPEEYLAGSLPASGEMAPRQPVQVALDLLSPEQVAVSFEFQFL